MNDCNEITIASFGMGLIFGMIITVIMVYIAKLK